MEKVTLESDAFIPMRRDFDRLLSQTVKRMIERSSDTSTITLKLDIELWRSTIVDDEAPDGVRDTIIPHFQHKVTSVMQMKAEEKGTSEGVYELSWNALTNEYAMLPISNEQTTFDQFTGGRK